MVILQPGYLYWDGFKYINQSAQGPAGPPGAGGLFIYQPGGTPGGNVYTSWTALMAARAAIVGPATIAIDDSITLKPAVDPGVWDLTNNTTIVGYKRFYSVYGPFLSFGDGANSANDAQLKNPSQIQDIFILSQNVTAPTFTASPLALPQGSAAVNFYNVILVNLGTPPIVLADDFTYISLSGFCENLDGAVVGSASTTVTIDIILYDLCELAAGAIVMTGDSSLANIYICSTQAFCNNTQTVATLYFNSGNYSGNWSAATTGYILTWAANNQANWVPGFQTGTLSLSSGTFTVNTSITITPNSLVYLTLTTVNGTTGTNYLVDNLHEGGPGSGAFTATSVNTAGSTVNTDNSTLNYLIVG